MGRDTVRFQCRQCLRCCTDMVLLTPWDAIRMLKGSGLPPEEMFEFITAEEIRGVEADDPVWLEVNGERFLMIIRHTLKRGCHFLDWKKKCCRIYEHRPILCRLYPFKYQTNPDGEYKGFILHDDVECPRERSSVVKTEALRALLEEDEAHQQDYRDLVAVFNRKEYPGKKPEDFFAMFVDRPEPAKPRARCIRKRA